MEIEVDVDYGKGWQETVTVSEDISGEEKYKLHKEKKTWKEANETCVRERGHLESILSHENTSGAFFPDLYKLCG